MFGVIKKCFFTGLTVFNFNERKYVKSNFNEQSRM